MQAIVENNASEEVARLIATLEPAKVVAFRPSQAAIDRVSHLIDRERSSDISDDERRELDYFMHIEHLMRMAKIYARQYSPQT